MAATTAAAAVVFSFYKLVECHLFSRTVRSFPGSSIHLRCRAPHLRPHALAAGEPSTELCVVLAGGGSGGHIFPALAIADELSAVRPNARIVFLGTASGMESEVVPSAGYEFVPVPKVCLARPFLSPLNLLLPFQLLRSIIASAAVLSRLCPNVVVGTGAYVSAPVCFAAIISGIMLVIQEQNCYPGITNRALAPYAEKIFLAFNACIKYFPRNKCVTGAKWFEDVKRVAKFHPRLFLTPFLDAMELAYAAADLVVSRAGAMTCTEILTAGKPSILIPSPTASDDHQTKNAYAMADLAGAHVLTEDELDSCSLQTAINNVLGDNNLMEEMSDKAMRASRPNAASHIAESILSILD